MLIALLAFACSCSSSNSTNCGENGESCCNGDSCADGLVCSSGICEIGNVSYSPVEGATCTPEGSLACAGSYGTSNVVLYCRGGTYTKVFRRPGLETCDSVYTGDQVKCGSIGYAQSGAPGAPCAGIVADGGVVEAACSFDLSKVEECVNGAWVDAVHCPPSSCTLLPPSPTGETCSGTHCANCGESVGDLCDFPAGDVICSTDLSAILECSDGKTVVEKSCGGGKCEEVSENGSMGLTCQ